MINVRGSRNDRTNVARLVLEARRAFNSGVVVLCMLALGLVLVSYIGVHVSKTLFTKTRELRFEVTDATGVVAGVQEVRFKGIPAGTIEKVQLDNGAPVLQVKLQRKYGEIYRNATAELRPSTPLQDMYLDITDPGTPAAGEATAADPLPSTQTSTAVRVDEVLNAFDGDTRTRLREILDDFGNGLNGHGDQLREAFVELTPFLQTAAGVTNQLARRAPLTRSLVHNTAAVMNALSVRDRELRTLVQSGSQTLGTLQAGSADLDATLRELPGTLAQVTSSFDATRAVLGDVDGALTAVQPVADHLPESLSAIRRLSAAGTPALAALRPPVRQLTPTAQVVRPLANDLAGALVAAQPQIPAVDRTTNALALCGPQLQAFFRWDASFTKFADSRGPFPRGNVVVGTRASGTVDNPYEGAVHSCAPGAAVGGRPVIDSDKG